MSKQIQKAMKARDITQTDLAAKMGVSPQAVQQWCTGKTAPKGKRLAELVKALDVSIDWLMTGTGEMIHSLAAAKNDLKIEPNASWGDEFATWDSNTPMPSDVVALPFFREVKLAAGLGISEVQENHGCKLWFAESTLRKMSVNPDMAACVCVDGNSMAPVLPSGTTVGIDKSKTNIIDGKMFAIDQNGHLRVKLLYRLPSGGVRVRSYNSDEWPDELYSLAQLAEIRILGQVFWYSVLL